MESKLVKEFLDSQMKLMNNKTVAKPASKILARPETMIQETTPESLYNEILDKKPSKKKVLKFLQLAIDSVLDDDD